MNVGGVIEVVSPGASKLPLGSGAGLTALGKGQGIGSFLSLLGEVIGNPEPAEGQPGADASLGSNTANSKSKNAFNGGKNSNEGKKQEPSSKPVLIQSLPEPPPVMVKPPLGLPTTLSTPGTNDSPSEAETGNEEQSGSELSVGVGGKSPVEAPASSLAQQPKTDVAFGLRWSSTIPGTETEPAISDSQPPQPSKPTVAPQEPIPVRTPQATQPGGAPVEASGSASASRTPAASTTPSYTSASASSSHQQSSDNLAKFETTIPRPVGWDTTEIPKASRTLQFNTEEATATNIETEPAIASSSSDPADQRLDQEPPSAWQSAPQRANSSVSIQDSQGDREASLRSTDIESALNVQSGTNDTANHNVGARSAPSRPANERSEIAPSRAPGTPREVSPSSSQGDRSQDESYSTPSTPKTTEGDTGPKRTMAPGSSQDEQKSGSLLPSIQTPTASRTPDAEPESSMAGDPQPKVETGPEINATSQPQPARQISLKLTGPDAAKVDVELSEKGGKVQVAVRTADRELAKSLQGDLGDLVGRLETKGFKTEAWIPGAAHVVHAAAGSEPSGMGQGSREHSGSGSDQQPGRQGRNGSNQRQQARWMAQFQESISTEETGTENDDH